MHILSYPKINIGLYVVARRPDGYSNIETVFYPVAARHDVLDIERTAAGVEFAVKDGRYICATEDNLCVKAFRLLQQECGLDGGIRILLDKDIPMGGGLGGGSSNAAAVLKALNELYRLGLSEEELRHFGLQLGSDVPFFIASVPAFATGKGEMLEPIPLDLSQREIRLVCPPCSMSTAEAYRAVIPHPAPINLKKAITEPIENWKNLIFNDFEVPFFAKFPELRKVKDELYEQGAVYVSLSGSGSTIYGIF